ncbi:MULTISPECIES: hypothetical protein [unclassified Rhizobium]|uniref:hypothetical protein n=1 Tax=unclassified Rhizobium TaxID=2613769 RepID=UPI000A4E855B|nr:MULTISPECIES: hypothetical protein [unclassified Rhizobium]
MARETLPVALDLMFEHESGYSNAKTDSGGPTELSADFSKMMRCRGVIQPIFLRQPDC